MPGSLDSITFLDKVDSTNNYAMGMVRNGLWKHGNACFAMEQSEGKGTRGKSWNSERNHNILLSIVAETGFLEIHQQFILSVIAALSCQELFLKYAIEPVKIKWPNDILWNDRKAAGILIENVIKGGRWHNSIVGIGMNINQTSFSDPNAVSLKQITGKDFDAVGLAKELYHLFFNYFEIIKTNPSSLLKQYNCNLYKRGEKVRLRKDRMIFETVIEEVTANGVLVTSDAQPREFNYGEIQWILNY